MLGEIAKLSAPMLSIGATEQQIAAKQFINDILMQYVARKSSNVCVRVDRLDQIGNYFNLVRGGVAVDMIPLRPMHPLQIRIRKALWIDKNETADASSGQHMRCRRPCAAATNNSSCGLFQTNG